MHVGQHESGGLSPALQVVGSFPLPSPAPASKIKIYRHTDKIKAIVQKRCLAFHRSVGRRRRSVRRCVPVSSCSTVVRRTCQRRRYRRQGRHCLDTGTADSPLHDTHSLHSSLSAGKHSQSSNRRWVIRFLIGCDGRLRCVIFTYGTIGEILFSSPFVCLYVSLSVSRITKKLLDRFS